MRFFVDFRSSTRSTAMSMRVSLLTIGLASAGIAHAANLVPNPNFDDGLDGWTQIGAGTVTADDSIGLPLPPSAHLVVDSTQGIGLESSCMPVDDGDHYDFHMNALAHAGEFSGRIEPFLDTDCTDPLTTIDTAILTGSGEFGLFDFALPDGSQSAKVLLVGSVTPEDVFPDVNFDSIAFGPTGTVPSGNIDIAQEGLTGGWFNPLTSGQGFEFVISPNAGAPTLSDLFGAWYTYDTISGNTDTQRWYSFQAGQIASGAPSVAVSIYQNIDGNFNAPPVTTAQPVGTGTLSFATCSTGLFTYTLDDGRSGAVPLQRLLPNVSCDDGGVPTGVAPSDFGLSGAWYNVDTGGQGFLIEVNPADAQVFVGWYAYALAGEGQGESGQRWFSAQSAYTVGSTSMDLTVFASTGGTFDSGATTVTTVPVGTATITFTSCTTATFDYTFTSGELMGQSGTIELSRLGAPLTSCSFPPPA
jgi:hypothetical protein